MYSGMYHLGDTWPAYLDFLSSRDVSVGQEVGHVVVGDVAVVHPVGQHGHVVQHAGDEVFVLYVGRRLEVEELQARVDGYLYLDVPPEL